MLGALDKVQDRNGLERGELPFLEQAHFKTKGTLLSLQLYIYIYIILKKRELLQGPKHDVDNDKQNIKKLA